MASLVMTGAIELQDTVKSLLSTGTAGKKIFRKAARAGAKVIQARVKASFPRKTGKAARSTKVKALKRKRGRIGVRVALYAATTKGQPYPFFVERGVKRQKSMINYGQIKGARVRDQAKRAALGWHSEPRLAAEQATEQASPAAQEAVLKTIRDELEKMAVKR